MRQLGFDHIGGYAVDALNHQRPRHCPEPVCAHFVGCKAHAPQGCIDGVVAHRPFACAQAREHVAAMAGVGLQFFQDGDCLGGQGHKVRPAVELLRKPPLHVLGRNGQQGLVEVDPRPFHLPDVAGPLKE
ncbi:hypothetical protein D3C72_1889370 [compost metagenome]